MMDLLKVGPEVQLNRAIPGAMSSKAPRRLCSSPRHLAPFELPRHSRDLQSVIQVSDTTRKNKVQSMKHANLNLVARGGHFPCWRRKAEYALGFWPIHS